ncbi:MAG: hypothetical protein IKV25_01215 [Clostridia bacterium]|nr:hypothetical protein [Bacteroidaceae bacterium]MBR4794789.1 hypothetical protein [Bacteroidaceae bacterium]MBR5245973.1 hypothetical protein [Clostridia bacterium]
MKEKDLLAMNLQFFAEDSEDEGVNETEPAEQSEFESEDAQPAGEEVQEEPAAPQFDTDRANAAFASMRRELEAARREQADIDALYARQYGGYTNPETGQPITSARDYFEAMEAQERMQARAQLQENNIDPRMIDNMIANSPAVRQAKAATAELNSYRASRMMDEDFKKVLALDPTKTSEDDILNDPAYLTVVNYIETHPGTRFDEAYKIVNFERLADSRGAAAKQAVVNQVKSKNHLSTGTSIDVQDSDEDIPPTMVEKYKEMFPEKSMKELKALYNNTLKSRRY